MRLAYLFLDVASFETSLILGLALGNDYLPNVPAMVGFYLLFRTGLYLAFFKLFLKRKLPIERLLIQSVLLLTATFFLIFILFAAVEQLPKFNSSLAIRYYLVAPLVSALISHIVRNFYKLEDWVS